MSTDTINDAFMQADTRRQLADVYGRLGRPDDEQQMVVHLEKSVGDVRHGASAKLRVAEQAHDKLSERLGKARAQDLAAWETALRCTTSCSKLAKFSAQSFLSHGHGRCIIR